MYKWFIKHTPGLLGDIASITIGAGLFYFICAIIGDAPSLCVAIMFGWLAHLINFRNNERDI